MSRNVDLKQHSCQEYKSYITLQNWGQFHLCSIYVIILQFWDCLMVRSTSIAYHLIMVYHCDTYIIDHDKIIMIYYHTPLLGTGRVLNCLTQLQLVHSLMVLLLLKNPLINSWSVNTIWNRLSTSQLYTYTAVEHERDVGW